MSAARLRMLLNAGLYSGTAAVQRLAGFVLFLWMAKTLSVQQYALFGLLYAAQTSVMTFALAGVVEAAVAALRDNRSGKERAALYVATGRVFVAMALAFGLATTVLLPLLVRELPVSFGMAALATGGGVALAYTSLEAQLVRLEELHHRSLLFGFIPPALGFLGGFIALLARPSVESFFVGAAAGVLVASVALAPWRVSLRADDGAAPHFRRQLVAGLPFIIVAFFGWVSGYGSNYLANAAFDAPVIARFTFALTISSVLQLVATALNQVWSPRFYQLTHTQPIAEVERKNHAFFRSQGIVLGLVSGAVVALYPILVSRIGGAALAYRDLTLELTLLFAYYVVSVPIWHAQNYFLAYGKGPELMRVTVITGVVGVAATVALVLALGPIGLYVGVLAQVVVRAIGYVVAARPHWRIHVAWDGVAIGLALALGGYWTTR